MKELEQEVQPQDSLEYLDQDAKPEKMNPGIAVRDGEYVTAEEVKSEGKIGSAKAAAGLAAPIGTTGISINGLIGYQQEIQNGLPDEANAAMAVLGAALTAGSIAYGAKNTKDTYETVEEFNELFDVDYSETAPQI